MQALAQSVAPLAVTIAQSGWQPNPTLLLILGVLAASACALLLLWMLVRALAGLIDRPRVPRPGSTYAAFTFLAGVALVLAISLLGLARLIDGHARVNGPTTLGQLRCLPMGTGKVQVVFTASSGASETFEQDAASCAIEATLLTLRPLPPPIGVAVYARVTRIGDRPRSAELPFWAPTITWFPLSRLVQSAAAQQATAAPDPNGVLQVVASDAGITLARPGS